MRTTRSKDCFTAVVDGLEIRETRRIKQTIVVACNVPATHPLALTAVVLVWQWALLAIISLLSPIILLLLLCRPCHRQYTVPL